MQIRRQVGVDQGFSRPTNLTNAGASAAGPSKLAAHPPTVEMQVHSRRAGKSFDRASKHAAFLTPGIGASSTVESGCAWAMRKDDSHSAISACALDFSSGRITLT